MQGLRDEVLEPRAEPAAFNIWPCYAALLSACGLQRAAGFSSPKSCPPPSAARLSLLNPPLWFTPPVQRYLFPTISSLSENTLMLTFNMLFTHKEETICSRRRMPSEGKTNGPPSALRSVISEFNNLDC